MIFKKIFIKFFLLIFLVSWLFWLAKPVLAADSLNSVNLYFFWGKGCPHCAAEEKFLEEMKGKYPQLEVKDFEIWYNKDNQKILERVVTRLDKNVTGVPFTVISDQSFVGFSEERTAPLIESAIVENIKNPKPDILAEVINNSEKEVTSDQQKAPEVSGDIIKIPFLGNISASSLSLPVLTVVVGALDGFNPCAMWVLLFLISMLLGMKDKKRMWILGSTFIFVSALVYFMFMSAWLNLILFIGVALWARLMIGVLALVGGGYNIKQFFYSKKSGCNVVNDRQREKIFEKIKKAIHEKSFWLALAGIIIVAFSVNLFELLCSAGLPAIYTQVLAMSGLPDWQNYLYQMLYVFVFMLDDLIVFIVAMLTLQMTGITTKYQKYTHIIGGVLMILIGILLIFKPEWLMFGS